MIQWRGRIGSIVDSQGREDSLPELTVNTSTTYDDGE